MTLRSVLSRILHLEQVHRPSLMTVIITGGLPGQPIPSREVIATAQAEACAAGKWLCIVGGMRQVAEARRAEWVE